MEGLIPFIYKAIKRKRTRMCYRSLSTGAVRGFDLSDFHQGEKLSIESPPRRFGSYKEDKSQKRHQRHRTMEDFSGERMPDKYGRPGQLVTTSRSRSLRIFSCAGGF